MTSRVSAAVCAYLGHRRLRRGDHRGAIRAFHQALRKRPGRFPELMNVAQAHLCARELHEARRYLAQAREADPTRYDLRAAALLASCGYDIESVCRPLPPTRPSAKTHTAVRDSRGVSASSLPYGDCADIDEYARFRAMPPISQAEIEDTDWDTIIGDLFDD
ncbi:MAG: tetratricopeptide repeat protein [Planctomycetota bacterium]|nr:tetratricopeptide repeat protein [Planctomycetota bacterium]